MKTKKILFLFPLLLMGVILAFTPGCNDDEDEVIPDAEISMFTLLNYGTQTETSVDKTGDVLLRFKGEVKKPATIKVYRTHKETGDKETLVDINADGYFQIIEDIVYMDPGVYTLYGEIKIGETIVRTEDDLTVTVNNEKVDVGDYLTINLEDVNQDKDQLMVGNRYALELDWGVNPGDPEPTNTRVEWESDNEAVATVEVEPGAYNDGWVYIHDEGSFRLTATSEEDPNVSFGKDFTGVENPADDRPEITVNSTSNSPQTIEGVGNLAVDVRFTLESEQNDPDPGDEHQWFLVNFAYDAGGISQTVEYSVPKANIERKNMPSGTDHDSYWLEAGDYTMRLWAPMIDEVSVPVLVWVSDAQVTSP
ncbi:MAG: hypothetical protein ACLFM1_07500 [Bacteroidales bacterium]